MKRKRIIEHLETIEEVMTRTCPRADIWQDECVYNMALIIREILIDTLKRETREEK